jgi:NADPH2:quinone reductase
VKAVVVRAQGQPFVVEERELAPPGPGELRVRHTAIAVNFIDVYHRTGQYPMKTPGSPGVEAAGVIVDVGAGVSHLQKGDRVAYIWREPGTYVEERNVPAARLIPLPASVPDDVVAASFVKGLTAEALLRRVFRVDGRHTVVVTAAAGGVGMLTCQWGRAIGTRVIGVVSSDEKARIALQAGAHHVLVSPRGPAHGLAKRVRELCPDGVDVVYDSVGKDTFNESLDMLKPRGLLALFGQASGPVEQFSPSLLAQKGSLFLTRPTLFDYIADPGEYRAAADALFDAIDKRVLTPQVSTRYALADAQRAHEDLESGKTTGALVLIP